MFMGSILVPPVELGAKSALIVYLNCEISKERPRNSLFLDLIELSDQTSDTISRALLNCLNQNGFFDDYLQENLVAFASVMLGTQSGVAQKLTEKYPNIILWHCMKHRIELAVSDSVDDLGAVNHFQFVKDKLYTLYSKSPKNQRKLAECSRELDLQLNKIGRILGTRWIARSFKSITAVWYGYQVLHFHFNKVKDDKSRTSTERSMYNGLIKRLTSIQFLSDLAIMYDVLAELSMLSENLQSRKSMIVYADKIIRRSITFLKPLKTNLGPNVLRPREQQLKATYVACP
ncbi:E3 SUMO-protein ligase KIAA1586 [Araneus ventricosus]|uniref:E3 SUMO-protein ligase KIAA1586 n=1 Tax=Araneus ventricosus TaxID=182803 RepID=A0A4Y2AQE4_ARAVE|nr:E3 SUMO-protein ligase KIAA1586 [Araneus ventricosus]